MPAPPIPLGEARSAPAQKGLPSLASTVARTAGSLSKARSVSARSVTSSTETWLAGGRWKTRLATWS